MAERDVLVGDWTQQLYPRVANHTYWSEYVQFSCRHSQLCELSNICRHSSGKENLA